MIKTAITTESDLNTCPMEIMKVSRKGLDNGWLEKRGSVLSEEVISLEPRDGMTPVYMLPISSMWLAGSNRNADYWPECGKIIYVADPPSPDKKTMTIEKGLEEKHPTFVTHALMYRNHNNDDPSKASGEIIASAYNKPMGRVEVISYVDNDKWENDLHDLDQDKNIGVSMSAGVDHDICIVCGNKAKTRRDYCRHMTRYRNAILDNGVQVGVVNENPTFIDLSSVRNNADRLGYGLCRLQVVEKSASTGRDKQVRELKDLCEKLAKMEKRVPVEEIKPLAKAMDTSPLTKRTVTVVRSYNPGEVAKAMKRKKIVLGPKQFAQIVGCDLGGIESQVESILPRLFDFLSDSKGSLISAFRPKGEVPLGLSRALDEVEEDLSVDPDVVEKRMEIVLNNVDDEGECEVITRTIEPKSASLGDRARQFAREYGQYQLSMVKSCGEGILPAIYAINRRKL